ncbi:MAG: DUF2764 family protein [Spirochaetaceae bacterium]|nr:MAG: DUF2764 family protein [Spirochaetaceae bacterium]
MSQYIYTVASLPTPHLDSDVFLSIEEFLEICRRFMGDRDYAELESAVVPLNTEQEPSNPVLAEWHRRKRGLQNQLAVLRAAKKEQSADKYVRPDADGRSHLEMPGVLEAARAASQEQSPLRAEEVLLRWEWNLLDELEVGHFFDLERLIIYYLRLQVLSRKARFNRPDGEERFKEVYQGVSRNFYGSEDTTKPENNT